MRTEIHYVPDSLGDLLSIVWSVVPVDGYLITAGFGAGMFLLAWSWRKLDRFKDAN